MDLTDLKREFTDADLEWRVMRSGKKKNGEPWAKVAVYVTNRAIQDRLDEVCGPENWCNEFRPGPDGGIVCAIAIMIDDFWVYKWDGAENTDVESIKGGLSNAMKRAAVQWGIGRYLYTIGESWADFDDNGKYQAKIDNQYYKWNPPKLDHAPLPVNLNAQQSRGKEVVVPSVKTPLTPVKVAEVMDGEVVSGQVTFQDIIKLVNSTSPPNMGEIVARAKEAMNDPVALKGLHEEISGTDGTSGESQTLLGDGDIPF